MVLGTWFNSSGDVYAPSLDHGAGDPVEDGYPCEPSAHKVVTAEGNYLLLEGGAWKDVSSMFDEKWQASVLAGLFSFSIWSWSRYIC